MGKLPDSNVGLRARLVRHRSVRRLLLSVLTVVLSTVAIFGVLETVPGNVVQQMMGQTSDPAAADSMRRFFGLDQPLYRQYFQWVWDALRGSFGSSWLNGQAAGGLVGSAMLVTAELTFLTLLLSTVIGIPLGVYTGLRHHGVAGKVGNALSALGLSAPIFWVGLLLLIAAAKYFNWSPPLSYSSPINNLGENLAKMFLPTLSLAFLQIAAYSQFIRDLVSAQLSEPYVLTARSKGLTIWRVGFRHILPNVLPQSVTFIGLLTLQILGGAVVIESIFGLPGVGRLMLDSINARDFPVVRAGLLIIVVVAVALNFLIDMSYRVLDPRIRAGAV